MRKETITICYEKYVSRETGEVETARFIASSPLNKNALPHGMSNDDPNLLMEEVTKALKEKGLEPVFVDEGVSIHAPLESGEELTLPGKIAP